MWWYPQSLAPGPLEVVLAVTIWRCWLFVATVTEICVPKCQKSLKHEDQRPFLGDSFNHPKKIRLDVVSTHNSRSRQNHKPQGVLHAKKQSC